MGDVLREEKFQANGRNLEKGTEISIHGERGRFRFMAYCVSDKGEWIDVYGGTGWRDRKGVMSMRSFSPDRIRTVHSKDKMRPDGRKGKSSA